MALHVGTLDDNSSSCTNKLGQTTWLWSQYTYTVCVCRYLHVYVVEHTYLSLCPCTCWINDVFLGMSRKWGELRQAVWMLISTDVVCMCVVVAGRGGQWNPHQTIYYNDRKQEVQPLHSHMAASCLGNWKKDDGEDDREFTCICVYLYGYILWEPAWDLDSWSEHILEEL